MSRCYSTGCLSFYYNEDIDVVYRRLDFLGHPHYRIGDDGSFWGRKIVGSGRAGNERIGGWRKLKGSGKTYRIAYPDGKVYLFHHLVLWAFVGKKPADKHECRHLDGNRLNNSLVNLSWGTYQQQWEDKIKHGRFNKGAKNGRAKKTEKEILKIRKLYSTGKYTQRVLAGMFNISSYHIWAILSRKLWKHI